MALTIGQLLGGAGTIARRQRETEEAERIARENQLKIEQQNRMERLRQLETQSAGQLGAPQAPAQFVGFEQIGGAPPGPIRLAAPPAAAPEPVAAPAPAPAPAAAAPAPETGPAGDTYYEDIYNRLAGERVLGVIPAVRAETMRMLRDPQAFTTEEIGRLYAIAQSKRDYNTARYLRDVLLGRGVPDIEIRNIRGQTRAGLRAIEEAQAAETRRAEEQRRLAELRGDRAPTAAPAPAAAPTTAQQSIQNVIRREGGYVADRADRGGETKFGISKRAYPNLDIANLTEEEAARIYKRDYWDRIKADELPENIREMAFDAAVNQGVAWTRRALEQANNDPQRFLELRAQRYQDIVAQDPTQERFMQGWMNRLREFAGGALEAVVPAAEAATTANTAAERLSTPPGVRMTAAQRPESISTYYAANPQNIGPERQNLDSIYQQQRARLEAQYNNLVRAGMGPAANQLANQVMEFDQKYRAERLMMDGMEALAQLEYGNDPRAISAVLSFYRGQPVNFELVEDGTYRMTMQDQRGQIQQRGVYTKDQVGMMARQYFDRNYLQAQQAFASEAAMLRFKSQLKREEGISAQQAQTIREVTVEIVKGNVGERANAGEFVATNMGDGKVVLTNKAGTKAYVLDTATGQTIEIDGVTVPVPPTAVPVTGMGGR